MPSTYDRITTTSPSGTQTVTFNSFSGYTHLIVVVNALYAAGGSDVSARFNSDNGTNYSILNLFGDGTSAGNSRETNDTYIRTGGSIGSTTIPGFQRWHIFNYAGSTNKTVLVETSNDLNGSGNVRRTVGLWRSTAAITSITFTATGGVNFASGSKFTIYGIKKA